MSVTVLKVYYSRFYYVIKEMVLFDMCCMTRELWKETVRNDMAFKESHILSLTGFAELKKRYAVWLLTLSTQFLPVN